ncbi:MAG: cupin domain-containing protein [Planctomycetaceae bacterium]|nr:cupin domain-containing protein [Planctomycetaceae bacterium]
MKFPMIHTDQHGETHFTVQDIPQRELAVGPPPNPTGQMSDLGVVTTMSVIAFPAGTEAPTHNAPHPYIVIVLSGEGEVVTSDGEARRFHPGDLLLCNDLTGNGHVTRAITDMTLAFVNRATT